MPLVFLPHRRTLFHWRDETAGTSWDEPVAGARPATARVLAPARRGDLEGHDWPLPAALARFAEAPLAQIPAMPGSVAAWTMAGKFALELVAREHVVPAVVRDPGGCQARWMAALSDPGDVSRVAALAAAMPSAAHAVPLAGGRTRRVWAPEALLRAFLDAAVDTLVRAGAATDTDDGRPATRPPDDDHVPWERRWWTALDEAQNIKNAASATARAARALRAAHRFALTGTPVENRLAELWSIFEFCNPGLLGSLETFRREYAPPIERYGNDDASARLRALAAPFLLRRLKSDPAIISDLPPKNEMKVFCTLTREQATLYQAVVDEEMRRIESANGNERRGRVLALLTFFKQICNHAAQYPGESSPLERRSGKLERAAEMLEEVVAEGDRALVFTQFREMGERLVAHLGGRLGVEVVFLHGGTPRKARETMVRRFQEDPRGPPIFVLSVKTGGTGLNLTAASHVFHFDRCGTRRSRTRPRTAPIASASGARCRCTSSFAPAPWRRRWTRCSSTSVDWRPRSSPAASTGSPSSAMTSCATCSRCPLPRRQTMTTWTSDRP